MSEENITYSNALPPQTPLNGGKYIIEKQIGEGGFSLTYKATQVELGRVVCVKEYFLSGKCVRDSQSLTVFLQGMTEEKYKKYQDAFVREAKMLSTLNHPSIVKVIDVFSENGTSYMVMPYIEGNTLQSLVDKNGPLPYTDTVNYIAQITEACGYIHERNILHRDIKPDNIMITSDSRAILIDFGSAREFQHDKTQMHTSILTQGYAPTEQYTANSRKGAYTDIYAIGATMYFLLTGQVPLEAAARLTEPMLEPKALNPSIPEEANRTILKAMQLKAENRHQSIQEFMDDLRNVRPSELIDESIGVTYETEEVMPRWAKFSLIGLGLVILPLVLFLLLRNPSGSTADEASVPTEDFTGLGLYPMIKVEGGTFTMGGADDSDAPIHEASVSDFWIGQFEVSRKFWEAIMGTDTPEQPDYDGIYTPEELEKLPIVYVSYYDAQRFVTQLNERTGRNFSLPTEEQWEYAARGGNTNEHSDYAGSIGDIVYGEWESPKPIDKGAINALGIYNMSGNVWEWCSSFYTKGKMSFRGGCYKTKNLDELKVYYRIGEESDYSDDSTGFRIVLN